MTPKKWDDVDLRKSATLIIATAAMLMTLVTLGKRVRDRRPTLTAKTVVSRTGRIPQQSEDAILLLEQATAFLTPGASVVYVRPNRRTTRDDQIMYLVALGQLPRHHVQPPSVLAARSVPDQAPDFVITFEGILDDDRYRLLAPLQGGSIYARK